MAGYLIKETTCEERKQIVEEALGNLSASCDGCMAGLADMYQDYIDGKKEIRDINMEFNARYERGDMDREERRSCPMSVYRIIVVYYHHSVGCELYVKFRTIHFSFGSFFQSCNRILCRTFCFPESAVSDHLCLSLTCQCKECTGTSHQ